MSEQNRRLLPETPAIVRSQYRLPSHVDAWLKAKATAAFRTKNSQLVALLQQLMEQDQTKRR